MGQPAMEFSEVDVLEAIVALIIRHAPMVLIFDDVHLADRSTIAALEYLNRRCGGSPVLVLGAMRGEDARPDHPVRRLGATEIRLEPPTAEELSRWASRGFTSARAVIRPRRRVITKGSRPDLRRSLSEILIARCRAEGPDAYRILVLAATSHSRLNPRCSPRCSMPIPSN